MPSPRGPYNRPALARVAFSAAAMTASDLARGLVPTYADGWAAPGSFAGEAQQLVAQAHEVLARAVVLERERGTSWAEIGEALGISRQAAHERFADLEARWRSALRAPWREDETGALAGQVPEGADEPEAWVRRLDDWLLRHREPTDPDPGRAPVSGTLARAEMLEEINDLLDGMEDQRYASLTAGERRAWLERKVRDLERLAEMEPGYRGMRVAPLEMARRQLVEARRQEAARRKT